MAVNFEVPVDDLDRAKKFYSDLFGWEIQEVPGRTNYLSITTSSEKSVAGGLIKRLNPKQKIINYFDVPSIDEYAAKVERLGGKIVVPKKAVPGAGYFAICHDTEDNTFGMWEENKNA